MSARFPVASPLQTCKLAAVLVTGLATIAALTGLTPVGLLRTLLIVAFLGPLLGLVVLVETVVVGYRVLATDDAPLGRFGDRPVYVVVRVLEVVLTVTAGGAFVVLIATLPEDLPGPGAIGVLFVGVALGGLVLVAVLVRTILEYVLHRRHPDPGDSDDPDADPQSASRSVDAGE
ncbi:hypothetical protein SAMN05192561_101262 [Halopenitus malekzadehii]|uniref:DUF2975 domain-containing protein n=1 Tax=Halopenitus malekzadehii TaxID=1267564 RepID=A0A1H6HUS6_9EURY|nr:hypothetical protein [Halopenitus malekzadehii]SEH37778.1 hypothetical protein SAMN05192561_101262 [Halopenitus malekzadehii]